MSNAADGDDGAPVLAALALATAPGSMESRGCDVHLFNAPGPVPSETLGTLPRCAGEAYGLAARGACPRGRLNDSCDERRDPSRPDPRAASTAPRRARARRHTRSRARSDETWLASASTRCGISQCLGGRGGASPEVLDCVLSTSRDRSASC